jgi:hypothetical protein
MRLQRQIIAQYAERELESQHLLSKGLVRKPYRSPDWEEELRFVQTDRHDHLNATNYFVRMCMTKRLLKHMFRYFGVTDNKPHPGYPVYFVTLCDATFVVSEGKSYIPLDPLKKMVRSALRGLSYLGVIEPATYVDYRRLDREGRRVVCWHAHLVVWGVARKELKGRIDALNASVDGQVPEFQGMALGLKGAHFKAIERGQFGTKIAYMLKMPRKQYSVGFRRKLYEETGLIAYYNNKRKAGTKARVALFRLMRHLRLEELMIAGGNGSELLKVVKREAQREWRQTSSYFQKRKPQKSRGDNAPGQTEPVRPAPHFESLRSHPPATSSTPILVDAYLTKIRPSNAVVRSSSAEGRIRAHRARAPP